jgi:predicted nucleotidyltransferase
MNRRQVFHQEIARIREIAARHGAGNLRVFGSMARGDDRPDSDVDLVVTFDSGRTLLDHGALVMDLQDLLGFRVDVLSEAGLTGRFRERVMREAVAL